MKEDEGEAGKRVHYGLWFRGIGIVPVLEDKRQESERTGGEMVNGEEKRERKIVDGLRGELGR